jgi:hypothetical protein
MTAIDEPDVAHEAASNGRGPARSPVIRALRFVGEETQFGLALEAVCQQSAVAEAFCVTVVQHARSGNAAAKRTVRRKHGTITCIGEHRLEARVSRRSARSRSGGRVDLRFSDEADWRLAVELKLGSGFGHKQLERYANSLPVATVVRDVSQVTDLAKLKGHGNWVGAATWLSLLEDLRALPVDPVWSEDWLALLEVMQSDGDFDVGIPNPPEVDAQVHLLDALADSLMDHFTASLHRMYGSRAATAISGLEHGRITQDRVWAAFTIRAQDGPWLRISVRNLWTRAPRLRVDYYTYPKRDWRARRRLREPHARIQRLGFDQRDSEFRFERPIEHLAGASQADHKVALEAIGDVLTKLVRSHVFDVEVERIQRDYRSAA